MQFAVGYQLAEEGDEPFAAVVRDYADHLAEVYFPWVGSASGRAALGVRRGYVDWSAQRRLEDDLQAFREMGLKLDLLFNANCYGERAISRHLQGEVASVLEHLEQSVGCVDIITTTSPAIAHTVQEYFPDVEVRASVNMRIGTPEAMSYVADLFDSFYIQRDHQRDLGHVRRVKAWCDEYRKGLLMLANSGCLRLCPGQTFHDNMVAHDADIDEMERMEDFVPHICWRHYRDRSNWPAVLQATWVRPEDLHHYEGLVDTVKLATRMHSRPRAVLEAYTTGEWRGNLLDLFEPSFSTAFAPHYIDNARFPEDWFEHTSRCPRTCTECNYCERVLEQVLVEGSPG
jgi:collagenase-like PrtC family protease